jgi:hypothetical protein
MFRWCNPRKWRLQNINLTTSPSHQFTTLSDLFFNLTTPGTAELGRAGGWSQTQ